MPRGRGPRGSVPCPDCDALIVWAITARGARQALDAKPNDDGNVLAYRDHTGTWRARSTAAAAEVPAYGHEHIYMPHAATCRRPVQQALPADLPDNVTPFRRRDR